jgi:hypothetical protein
MKIAKYALVVSLISGIASLALAGPGPQYWAERAREAELRATAAQAAAAEKSAPVAACSSCACCKTEARKIKT